MTWQARVNELRALPTRYGKPMGIWTVDRHLKAEGYQVTNSQLRDYLGIGRSNENDLFKEMTLESPGLVVPAPMEKKVRRGAYDRACDAFFDFINRAVPRFTANTVQTNPKGLMLYCVISDVHAPWHDKEAIINICHEALSRGARILIIAGDFADFHRISRWAKSKLLRFEEELAAVRVLLEYLASIFDEVWILGGNHDIGRWARTVAELISEEIRFLVKSPMDVLLADLPNVKLVGHRAPFGNDVGWLFQLGDDAILTHCEVSSAQQGVNLEKLKQWVREWGGVLGFNRSPRLITSGHTHRLTEHHEDDCLLIETGTTASWDAQAYQFEQAALKNRKPGVKGWTLVVQEDGVTNLRETRTFRLAA